MHPGLILRVPHSFELSLSVLLESWRVPICVQRRASAIIGLDGASCGRSSTFCLYSFATSIVLNLFAGVYPSPFCSGQYAYLTSAQDWSPQMCISLQRVGLGGQIAQATPICVFGSNVSCVMACMSDTEGSWVIASNPMTSCFSFTKNWRPLLIIRMPVTYAIGCDRLCLAIPSRFHHL